MTKRHAHYIGFYLTVACLLIIGLPIVVRYLSQWSVGLPASFIWLVCLTALVLTSIGISSHQSIHDRLRGWFSLSISIVLIGLVSIWLFFSMLFSPAKQLLDTTTSPNGAYTIDLYRGNGGATTSFWIVGELDGPLWTTKRIYYHYNKDQVDFNWVNDHTIEINNHPIDLANGEVFQLPN